MTIDHIRPKAIWKQAQRAILLALYQDYNDMNYNTTSACRDCNQAKGCKELLHFMLESLPA